MLVGAINNISFQFPSFSPLTQPENLADSLFCDETSLPESCAGKQICPCVHRLKVKLNSIVELVVLDETTGESRREPLVMRQSVNFEIAFLTSHQHHQSSFPSPRLSAIRDGNGPAPREASDECRVGQVHDEEKEIVKVGGEAARNQRHNLDTVERLHCVPLQSGQSWLVAAALSLR